MKRLLIAVMLVLLACVLGAENIYDDTTVCEALLQATASNVLGFECSARIKKSGGPYDIFVKMSKNISDEQFRENALATVGMAAEMTKNSKWRSNWLYILDAERVWRIKTSDCRKAIRIIKTEGDLKGGLFMVEKFQMVF